MLSHLTMAPVFFTLVEPKPLVYCVLNMPVHSCIASMRLPFLQGWKWGVRNGEGLATLPMFCPSGVWSLILTSHRPSVFLSLAPDTEMSTQLLSCMPAVLSALSPCKPQFSGFYCLLVSTFSCWNRSFKGQVCFVFFSPHPQGGPGLSLVFNKHLK